jgi:DNA-binding response OmpR family regulator
VTQTQSAQARSARAQSAQAQSAQAQPATILVADDEQDIRELVAYRLSRSGYTIIEARDGEEAFHLAADQSPDMAVLDVMMPRLNGFDLTERLRLTPATQRLPILLMSASVQEADISRGFAAGADGYLTKPFTPDQLLTRVRDVLSRG